MIWVQSQNDDKSTKGIDNKGNCGNTPDKQGLAYHCDISRENPVSFYASNEIVAFNYIRIYSRLHGLPGKFAIP